MRLLLTIVIPTIVGRESWFDRCWESYRRTLLAEQVLHRVQMMVFKGEKSCGIAWNKGIAEAEGEFIHLTADDIEPLDGWLLPAIESVARGELPAARILNSDGSLQSCGTDHTEQPDGAHAEVARIPFASRKQFAQIGSMMEEQYMGDYWFSHRGRQCGYPTKVVRDYAFLHHLASEGRKNSLNRDIKAYRERGGR
jgi:hypothetical protein